MKMNKYVISFAFFFLFIGTFIWGQNQTAEVLGFQGPLSSVEEKITFPVKEAYNYSSIKYFNEDGLLSSMESYRDGKLQSTTNYAYDASGRQTLMSTTDLTRKDWTESEYYADGTYKKDVYGGVIADPKLSTSSIYDPEGYLLEQKVYDRFGALSNSFETGKGEDYLEYVRQYYSKSGVSSIISARYTLDGRMMTQSQRGPARNSYSWKWDYFYNGDNKPVKITRFNTNYKADPDNFVWDFEYAANGTLTRIARSNNGELTEIREYSYSGTRKTGETVEYFTKLAGEIKTLGRWIYRYDFYGNLISAAYLNEQNEFTFNKKFEYAEGKRTYYEYLNDAGYTIDGNAAEFDRHGRELKTVNFVKTGLTAINEYDAGDRLAARTTYDRTGQIISADSYEYDSHGNTVDHKRYGPGGQLISEDKWTYEYDKYGNWTGKTQYVSDNGSESYDLKSSEVVRIISYY